MALTQDHSAITVSKPFTGDALIRGITLTGWSADIDAHTQGGKMFWTVTTGGVLNIYSDDAKGTLICTGAISSGAVTLAGGTGVISGSAKVAHTAGVESTGVLVLSYADESDLVAVMHSCFGYTSTGAAGGNWNGGGTRMELAFNKAKRRLDGMIRARLGGSVPLKADNTRDITGIVITQGYREAHAHLTAAIIEGLQYSIDTSEGKAAQLDYHERQASDIWAATECVVNKTSDNKAEGYIGSYSAGRG